MEELNNPHKWFNNRLVCEILDYLHAKYKKVGTTDIQEWDKIVTKTFGPNTLIIIYINKVEDTIDKAKEVGYPYADG